MSADLINHIESKKLIAVVGSGGVGKTTLSVAIGFGAAMRGKKVAVLSIDPAKRLAAALDLKMDGSVSSVKCPEFDECGGALDASMLDHQAVFDELVEQYSPSPKIATKIKNHLFYKAASTNLAGAVELMALAKLEQLVSSGKYDLVILDTPPDVHALDFISRPDALAKFIDHRVTTWMLKPFVLASKLGVGKVMQKGEKLMGGISKVAGVKALQMMAEFLILMQDIIKGLHECGTKVSAMLRLDSTAFLIVSAPKSSSTKVSKRIASVLSEENIVVSGIVWNRSLTSLTANSPIAETKDIPLTSSEALLAEMKHEQNQISELEMALTGNTAIFTIAEQSEALTGIDSLVDFASQL